MAINKTIFWDIGGVFLSNGWDRHQRARALTALGVDLEEYEARHEEANYTWERGLSTDVDYFNKTIFFKPRTFTLEDVWAGVRSEQKILNPGCFDIIDRLNAAGKYRQATLNNESRELNAYRLDAFDLRRRFDFFICSGYVHEMKPAAEIYIQAIETSGNKPADTYFIDDKKENAEAASALGMHGIHFQSPEQLLQQFTSLGIEL
jgi:putative hydrolase of the HAD superfamily